MLQTFQYPNNSCHSSARESEWVWAWLWVKSAADSWDVHTFHGLQLQPFQTLCPDRFTSSLSFSFLFFVPSIRVLPSVLWDFTPVSVVMHLIGVHTSSAPRDSYGPLCVLQTKTCQEVTVHHLSSNPAEDCMKFNITESLYMGHHIHSLFGESGSYFTTNVIYKYIFTD